MKPLGFPSKLSGVGPQPLPSGPILVYWVGQNRIYTPYMTVYLVISSQKYCTYTVYIGFWPTPLVCVKSHHKKIGVLCFLGKKGQITAPLCRHHRPLFPKRVTMLTYTLPTILIRPELCFLGFKQFCTVPYSYVL
jgi:hypothetical protein